MNVNPTAATELDPGPRFTQVQLQTAEGRYEAWRGNLIHTSCMIQHLAGTITGWSGCRYTINQGYIEAFWDMQYGGPVKNIQDIIADVEDDPEQANLAAAARIMRVFIFHRLTDLYGDIPYSEAGMGFIENVSQPRFDPQEEIYADMLSELEEAVSMLDPSLETYGNQDLFFSGDVDRWRKFGNSLMLRLGMRLSEVDAAMAEDAVRTAIEGGVMTSNDDIVYIDHQTGPDGLNRYGVGEVFQDFGIGGHGFRMSDTMVDMMLNISQEPDPRLNVYARLYNSDGAVVSEDPSDFQGLPNGLTGEELGQLDTYDYVQPHRGNMVRYDSPNLFLTYGEVEFLLAEAALRGWGAPQSAQDHYEEGIRASMKHLTLYGAPEISDEAVDSYIAGVPQADFESVGTQKWLTLFLNGYEAFSEWRRTGFPELTPVNYPGNVTNATIPRRLLYPGEEEANNAANYQEALSRQGPDQLTTRVWWDVE